MKIFINWEIPKSIVKNSIKMITDVWRGERSLLVSVWLIVITNQPSSACLTRWLKYLFIIKLTRHSRGHLKHHHGCQHQFWRRRGKECKSENPNIFFTFHLISVCCIWISSHSAGIRWLQEVWQWKMPPSIRNPLDVIGSSDGAK